MSLAEQSAPDPAATLPRMTSTAQPTSAQNPHGTTLGANLVCLASILVWSMGFPLADALLRDLPPLLLCTLRLCIGTLFLLPVWRAVEGHTAFAGAPWLRGLWVGGLGFGIGAAALVYAQQLTDGVTVSIIFAAMPIAGIAQECLFDGRPMTPRLFAGMGLSVIGGVLVYLLRADHGALHLGLGAAIALLSVIAFSWASRASVIALKGQSALARSALTIGGAALATLGAQVILGAIDGQGLGLARVSGWDWTLLAIYAVLSMCLSQVLFIHAVARLGVGVASMHINATPFYVMLFALALGHGWSWLQAFGAVIVCLGVIVTQGGARFGAPQRPEA